MKKGLFFIWMWAISATFAYAECDITRFRWECDLPMKLAPSRHVHSLVYCGMSFGYLTEQEYETLKRYTRRSVNMVLNANGEMIDAPCIPADKYVE